MTRDEACTEITKLPQKILEGSKTKEELALTGVLALVVASVNLELTIELMRAMAPFAKILKGIIDQQEGRTFADEVEKRFPGSKALKGRLDKNREEVPTVEWPDELEGKVM